MVRYILLLSFLLINASFVNTAFASSEIESTKVSELSVEDLRKIVRSIVQDSIEKCEVKRKTLVESIAIEIGHPSMLCIELWKTQAMPRV